MYEYGGLKISWLGHDSFRIRNGKVIYIDPYQIGGGEKADILLISHEHFDHCSADDIKKIANDDTTIVAIESCRGEVSKAKVGSTRYVKPGDKVEVSGIRVEAVPAYNVNKFRSPGKPFHPKEEGKVGFIIDWSNVRIYHAGDTDLVAEMTGLKTDVALLPVSGTYVMTADEAAEAVNRIKPKVAIPMHYGAIVGSRDDAEKFRKLAKCDVAILNKE